MENIKKTLDRLETLRKPEGKAKYGGLCEEINNVKIRWQTGGQVGGKASRLQASLQFLQIQITATISGNNHVWT